MNTKFGVFVLIAVAICSSIAMSQTKRPEVPPVQIPFKDSLQAVVVTTADWSTVQGRARLFERRSTRSKWTPVGDSFPIVLGRSGLGWGDEPSREAVPPQIKKEGDGNSPAGRFPLTFAFGVNSKPGNASLPYTKLEEFTECVDDVNSTFYNKIVNRMQVGNFDWKSSEKMLEVGPAYDLGVFVAYNSYPPIRGNGSCIFLHIWKDANTGTSGCTAMEKTDLQRIVGWLDPKKHPYLIQLPEKEYAARQRSWNLPKLK
ncbi:MAG: L,D-transpeptidase family protein [Candidatus Binatia bacterium]